MPRNLNVTPLFVLAGESVFTVSNGEDRHFTFKVYKSKPSPQYPNPGYFAKVLTGPNNAPGDGDYTYLGMVKVDRDRPLEVDPKVRLTGRSRYKDGDLPVVVLRWALRVIWQSAQGKYVLPEPFSIRHLDRCGKCGRPLTTPESLTCGLGPDCAAELGIQWGNSRNQGGGGAMAGRTQGGGGGARSAPMPGGSAPADARPQFASFDFGAKHGQDGGR